MKTLTTLFIIGFCAALFTGCSKNADTALTPQEQAIKNLTGDGNRYWHLSKVYVNGVQQALTDPQMKYTKTYTVNPALAGTGFFTNSDGYTGTWKLLFDSYELKETITNNPSGPILVVYDINQLAQDTLDIESTQNLKTVREVYYAY